MASNKFVACNVWVEPSPADRNRDKARKVTYIVYPESAAENWLIFLRETNLKVAVSPLHDKDLNEDGSFQKPHHHVVVVFEGPVSWYVANDLCNNLKAYKHFQKLRSSQDMVNYLTHDSYTCLDKFKYSKDDIQYIGCTELDFMEDEYLRVIDFIEENHIMSLRSLIQGLLCLGYEGRLLIKWVTGNSYFITAYLKSFQNRVPKEKEG